MTTYILTTGTNIIDGGSTGGNTIVATPDTINGNDTIDAGTGGGNVLELSNGGTTGAVTFDLTLPTVLTDIESVVVDDADTTVSLRPGLAVTTTLSAAGNDTIYLATAGDTVLSNGGSNDTVYVPAALVNSVTADGGGFGILYVEGAVGQSVSLGPKLTDFAYVHIDQNGDTLDTGNLSGALVYIDNTFSAGAQADTVILRGNGESVTDYTGGNVIDFAGGAGTLDLPYAGPGPEGTETLQNFTSLDSVILDGFSADATAMLDAATDVLTVSDAEGDSQAFQLFGSYQAADFSITNNGGTTPETLTYSGTVSGTTYFLTTGADTIEAGATGGNVVIAGPDTLSNGDTIDAGTGGGNELLLTGAGVFDLTQPDTLTDIGAVISQAGGQTIDLRAGLPVALTLSNSGSETVTVANAGDSVAGGTGGHNTAYVPLDVVGEATIDLGSGDNNTLYFTGVGQTATLEGNIAGYDVATAHLAQSGDTLDLNGTTFQSFNIDPGTGSADLVTLGSGQFVQDITGGNTLTLKGNDNVDLNFAGYTATPQAPETLVGFGEGDDITLQQFTTNQAVSYDATTDRLTVTGENGSGQSVSETVQLAGDYYVGTFSISDQTGQPGVVTFSGTVSTTPPATTPVTPIYWDGQYGTLVGSDGTQSGTSAIEPYTSTIQSAGFQTQVVVNGKLYATSTGGGAVLASLLYASDGTTAGTMPLIDFAADGGGAQINPNETIVANSIGAAGTGAAFLTAVGTGRTLVAGQTTSDAYTVTLWGTDGTTAGTHALASYVSASLLGPLGQYGASAGGRYYYIAATGTATASGIDWGVYATDGATVTRVQDTGTIEPTSIYADNAGGIYYVVNGAIDHSDGTASGTGTAIAAPANNGDIEENALFGTYNGDGVFAYSYYGEGNTSYLGLTDPSGHITQLGTIGYFGNVIYDSAVQVDATHLVFDNQGTLSGSAGEGALAAITYAGLPTGATVFAQFGTGSDVVASGTLYFVGQVTSGSSTYQALFSCNGVTATLLDDFGQTGSGVGQLTADGATVFLTVRVNGAVELRRTDGTGPTQLVGPTNGLFFDPANIVAGPLTPDSPAPTPQTYTLTTGTDTITGGASDNTVVATNDTLNGGDRIDGGTGGRNVLLLQGGGTFDLSAPTSLANFTEIDAQPGGVSGATQAITLRDGLNAIVRVIPGHAPETITGANNSDQIVGSGDQNFSGGYDTTVIVGAATETIDVTNALARSTAANAGALIEGPSTLTLTTGGTATLNPDDQLSGTTIDVTAATDLSVGGGGTFAFASYTTIDLLTGGDTVALGDAGVFSIVSNGPNTIIEAPDAGYHVSGTTALLNGDTIEGFGRPDAVTDDTGLPLHSIDLTNLNAGSFTFTYAGDELTVNDGTNAATLTVPIANFNSADLHHEAFGAGTVVYYEITCFAAGTRLATPEGERAVETLRAGDSVLTASGTIRPVRWVGRRRIDPAAHREPASVLPVRIKAGAFGDGLPRRDLLVSPDHALLVDGVLVPARLLLNGRGIASAPMAAPFRYWHVELDTHDILLAEGLPAESYLDTGNRAVFDDGAVTALHPDFAAVADRTGGCLPLVTDAARVRPIWRRLAAMDAGVERAVRAA